MRSKRMFSQEIVGSDIFLDMSLSTQALYFHLGMSADDDGFINNPKKIVRMIGANEDEVKILLAKNLLIVFENGLLVVTHWLIHNHIRADRKKDTLFSKEMAMLDIKDSGIYEVSEVLQPSDNQVVDKRVLKLSKDKLSKGNEDSSLNSFISSQKVADYLLEKIRTINPKFKTPTASAFDGWIKDIDLAIRIDKRSFKDLIEILDYIYSEKGEFWRSNILSGKKLRIHFEKIFMQIPKQEEEKEWST